MPRLPARRLADLARVLPHLAADRPFQCTSAYEKETARDLDFHWWKSSSTGVGDAHVARNPTWRAAQTVYFLASNSPKLVLTYGIL